MGQTFLPAQIKNTNILFFIHRLLVFSFSFLFPPLDFCTGVFFLFLSPVWNQYERKIWQPRKEKMLSKPALHNTQSGIKSFGKRKKKCSFPREVERNRCDVASASTREENGVLPPRQSRSPRNLIFSSSSSVKIVSRRQGNQELPSPFIFWMGFASSGGGKSPSPSSPKSRTLILLFPSAVWRNERTNSSRGIESRKRRRRRRRRRRKKDNTVGKW